MKYIFIILISVLFFITTRADEGMWLPLLLEQLNETQMQKMGLKLSAEDIYSINKGSLKDAIVHFGGGCTAEVVSNNGLLLTNHHCGYGQIQTHSTVKNDYLTNGFWAKNNKEELKNSDLKATFIVSIEDVTKKILDGILDRTTLIEREDIIKKNIKELKEIAIKNTHYNAVIKPFFYGNQYYLFITETFTDIRLVGAPPSSIGKFGGDTDNWMWPRHTGDFSIFRIYANKNNEPADFSMDNVPYHPKHYFPISLKGVKEGDFTMVYGFPGRTQEYLTSQAVDYVLNKSNPKKIAIREKILSIWDADMKASDAVRIKYAAKYASKSNYHKKWIGERNGLIKLNAINVKKQFETKFNNLVSQDEQLKAKYSTLLKDFEQQYLALEKYALARDYFIETIYRGPEIFSLAYYFRGLTNELTSFSVNKSAVEKGMEKLQLKLTKFYKNYNQPTDKKVFATLLKIYREQSPKELQPAVFKQLNDKFKGDYNKFTDFIYSKSIFSNEEKTKALLNNFNESTAKKIKKDPLYIMMDGLYSKYFNEVSTTYKKINNVIDGLYSQYLKAQQTIFKTKVYYPDANSTLRLTYGKVEGSIPRDGMQYTYYTTMAGIIEKNSSRNPDYIMPEKFKDLSKPENFGRYGENGELHICFTASNHTTGGNSGSPVINGSGELIGINFDRSWESTMSDIMFDPERCRNIVVDIRYVLFVIDKYAGAKWLVDEMDLVTKDTEWEQVLVQKNKVIAKNPNDAEAFNKRGLAYFNLGNRKKAELDFKKATELDAENANYFFNLATVHALNNDLKVALEILNTAISLNENYTEAYYNRGKVHAEFAEFDMALADFNKVILLNPNHAKAYNNRGIAKNIYLENKQGCPDIKKAMELGSERAKTTYKNWCE